MNTIVLSWNTGNELNSHAVRSEVFDREADIAVFPEASDEQGVYADTYQAFANNGYTLRAVDYDDDDNRLDQHQLAVAVKTGLMLHPGADLRPVGMGGRMALQVSLGHTDVLGLHLDDRSESRRQHQATYVARLVRSHAVMLGDFNATHGTDPWSLALRLAEPLVRGSSSNYGTNLRKRTPRESLQAAGQMASGKTLKALKSVGFKDAARRQQPTIKRGPVRLALDHILTRGEVGVVKPTTTIDTEGLTEHSIIMAELTLP